MELQISERTLINNETKIALARSPIFVTIPANVLLAQDFTVYLWVWTGSLSKVLGNANFVLNKKKISAKDNYVQFTINELILPFINPDFAYNQLSDAAVKGQAVFFQVKYVINTSGFDAVTTMPSMVATSGYRWNYERQIYGDNGIESNRANPFTETVNKWYNKRVNDYFKQNFAFITDINDTDTDSVIVKESINPPNAWQRCTQDPYLIVFLNKLGLWEYFTPNGKVIVSIKTSSDTQRKAFRRPDLVDNSYTHSKVKRNIESEQSYAINTGSLDQTMNDTIEQIINSEKVYLIRFKGDLVAPDMVGITIDNTFITIDDTFTTIDSTTVTLADVGLYKTFQQIPVICNNTDLTLKTRLNDRNKIDYLLNFDETTNKIWQI